MSDEPKIQPHYGGWALYDDIWEKIPMLPNSTPGREHLRCSAMKRLVRLGGKDDPIFDLNKAIAEIEKLLTYYPDGLACPIDLSMEESTLLGKKIRSVFLASPMGFDPSKPVDRLRHWAFIKLSCTIDAQTALQMMNELVLLLVDES